MFDQIMALIGVAVSPFVAVGYIIGAIYCALDYGFYKAHNTFKTRISWF